MLLFILRRLGWSALAILGVMLVTFLLFRVPKGDIAAANLGQRATEPAKAAWRHRYGYDKPLLINHHRRLVLTDLTSGKGRLSLREDDKTNSNVASALELVVDVPVTDQAQRADRKPPEVKTAMGRYVAGLSRETPLAQMTAGKSLIKAPTTDVPSPQPVLMVGLRDGTACRIDFAGVTDAGDIIDRINNEPECRGKLSAGITKYTSASAFDSQFFHHLLTSVTFQSRSFKDNRKLTDTIVERGPYSLALTVPAMAFEFVFGLSLAAFVAYYRGTRIDKFGVFLSVLGMCIPFLAFMIYGSYFMFLLAPSRAYGIFHRANIYLPIGIMVVASLGGMVRFYRTIILDETNRDYVRTARAKGVALPSILFKHVLRNCMLPILTNLILSIPFLIMGSLLLESYFGIPGLGDLMITSISNGNEPILNGLVFLTALIYTIGVLLTDLSYALFDPRIRLG